MQQASFELALSSSKGRGEGNSIAASALLWIRNQHACVYHVIATTHHVIATTQTQNLA
ncbi:hypothetical protein Mapa_016807 [Marchantia paleacea]|nr:hypothetical protein Mapa_016807 [Marchantia paleacea]